MKIREKQYKTIENEIDVKIPHVPTKVAKKDIKAKVNTFRVKNPLLKSLATSIKNKGVFGMRVETPQQVN